MRTELWTDGSGVHDGGPGGWAYVAVVYNDDDEVIAEREGAGGIPAATNQRAEMLAVIEGLLLFDRITTVEVVTDSEYVMNGFTKGWVDRWKENGWVNRDHEPVANRDLWEQLDAACSIHDVSWRHVKGHLRKFACTACSWEGPKPAAQKRRRLHSVTCRLCDSPTVMSPAHPYNWRCDELAGAERKALLDPDFTLTEA